MQPQAASAPPLAATVTAVIQYTRIKPKSIVPCSRTNSPHALAPQSAAWRPHHARALRRRRPADPTTVVVTAVGARGITGPRCAPVAVSTAADEGGTGAAGRTERAPPVGTWRAGNATLQSDASLKWQMTGSAATPRDNWQQCWCDGEATLQQCRCTCSRPWTSFCPAGILL